MIDWSKQATSIVAIISNRGNLAKLTALFITPLFVCIYMSSLQIERLSIHNNQLNKLEKFTILATKLSALLHELQKERGYSSVYLTGYNQSFLDKLKYQYTLTDQAKKLFFDEVLRNKTLFINTFFNQKINTFESQLDKLHDFRTEVKLKAADNLAAIDFYSALNNKSLRIISNIVKLTVTTELSQSFFSYISLLKAKEMTGIERATLGIVFSKSTLSKNELQKQIELGTAQAVYLQEFTFLASASTRASFNKLSQSHNFLQVENYHDLAYLKAHKGISKVNVEQWFTAVTWKINYLQQIEKQISEELLTKAKELQKLALRDLAVWKITLVLILGVIITAGIMLIRNINHKNINYILDVAKKNQLLLKENRTLSRRNYQVQEQERKQLAAELHDQCGQQLTGMKLQADFICHYINNTMENNPPDLTRAANTIVNSSNQLINSIRAITNGLRPLMLDQFGLAEAIKELMQQWQLVMPTMRFTANIDCPNVIDDKVAIGCFRIIQEAITNSCKHAKAKSIQLSITLEGACNEILEGEEKYKLVLKIIDDGIGLSKLTTTNGLGLISMRERAEALNGRFTLSSTINQGVSIQIQLPIIIKNTELSQEII